MDVVSRMDVVSLHLHLQQVLASSLVFQMDVVLWLGDCHEGISRRPYGIAIFSFYHLQRP